jgi:signal transduction histidine kinase
MRRLVCDLLDSAAIDGGAMRVKPARRELRGLLDEAFDALAPLAAEAGVSLEQVVPEGLPPAWVDADRIQQVLANLIGNAIKFTALGGTVRVSARLAGDALAVAVADTGVGIASDEIPRVFDRFWRAERSRKVGSGLGLAIAKSIVELSGGTIALESELNVGTTVTFTIPVAARLVLV